MCTCARERERQRKSDSGWRTLRTVSRTYTHTYAPHAHAHTHTRTHTRTHAQIRTFTHAHVHTHARVRMYRTRREKWTSILSNGNKTGYSASPWMDAVIANNCIVFESSLPCASNSLAPTTSCFSSPVSSRALEPPDKDVDDNVAMRHHAHSRSLELYTNRRNQMLEILRAITNRI